MIRKTLVIIGGTILFVFALVAIDKIDQHKTEGIVNTVYQNEAIVFKTDDGNLWIVETDDTDNVDCGDTYMLTFKEFENTNLYDDAIVDYEPIQ